MILVPVRHSKISRALTVQGGIPASLHLCLLGKELHGRSSDLRSYLVITFSLLMMRQAVKAIILAKASFYLVISSDRWTQNATQRSHYAKLIVLRLFEPHFNILFTLSCPSFPPCCTAKWSGGFLVSGSQSYQDVCVCVILTNIQNRFIGHSRTHQKARLKLW